MNWEILGLSRLENMLKSSDSPSGKYSLLRQPRVWLDELLPVPRKEQNVMVFRNTARALERCEA